MNPYKKVQKAINRSIEQTIKRAIKRQEKTDAENAKLLPLTDNIVALAREILNQRPQEPQRDDLLVLADALEETGAMREAKICRNRKGDHYLLLMRIHVQAMAREEQRERDAKESDEDDC